jgi:rhodanese-related sulfurtransferase
MAAATKLTPGQVKERMDRGEPVFFIDARNPQAWQEAKTMLPGAVRVPADHVVEHLGEIPRDRTVVAYCT